MDGLIVRDIKASIRGWHQSGFGFDFQDRSCYKVLFYYLLHQSSTVRALLSGIADHQPYLQNISGGLQL